LTDQPLVDMGLVNIYFGGLHMADLGDCVDCGEPVHSTGRCKKHYKSWWHKQPYKDCECGCGKKTKGRYAKGHHTRFFTNDEQRRRAKMNDGSTQRERGDLTSTHYRKVRGQHEHRLVAEQKYGRVLGPDDIVHHVDGNKRNNHPDNLQLMTRSEHIAVHRKEMVEALRAKSKKSS